MGNRNGTRNSIPPTAENKMMQARLVDRPDMFALCTASWSTITEHKEIYYLQRVVAIEIDRRRLGGIYCSTLKEVGQLILDEIQSWFYIRNIPPFARSEKPTNTLRWRQSRSNGMVLTCWQNKRASSGDLQFIVDYRCARP